MPPQPIGSDLHVDTLLTNISLAYTNQQYIADQVFPIVVVNKQSGIVPEYEQSHWFRDSAQLRLAGSRSRGGGWTVKKDQTYFADRYSWRQEIDDMTRKQTDDQFKLDTVATNFATDKVQMRREVAMATDFFKTGVWTDVAGGTDFTAWDDYASSNPLVDLTAYDDLVELRIGREPNTLVIGKPVWNTLRWHPALIDVIKYTERGLISEDLLKSLLGVPKVLIGRAIYTNSPEGTPEANVVYERVWGKSALLMYVPDAPSLLTPAAGYTFVWDIVPDALQYIKRMRDEEREVDIIEANTYFDQKATSARAAQFLSAVVS